MKTYKTEKRTVEVNNLKINYTLNVKNVKNINLRVKRDGSIYVSANRYVPIKAVDSFVKSNAVFIFEHSKKIEENKKRAVPDKITDGKSILFLGKWLNLKVYECRKEGVNKLCNELILNVKDTQNEKRKANLLEQFFKEQCHEVFSYLSLEVFKEFEPLSVEMPIIKVRKMKARWGSCQPLRGIITLNSFLIFAPLSCIKYVVAHEFCHFIHPNHQKQFYLLLEKIIPDWKEQKRLLRELQTMII